MKFFIGIFFIGCIIYEKVVVDCNFVINVIYFSLFIIFEYVIYEVYFYRVFYDYGSSEMRVIVLEFKVYEVDVVCCICEM